ncbi:putative pseudouridine-5'-monophosphatase [Tritrichomonas foetus]|uniref:Pseudouridine-5'-monophosphatase n=1 Tax=Tritrichomonas foetus TaxID=1144522 RepID=A0A1J4JT67_9EUKA|nr:putative pseudouridine-5'-monophosphatase [Tritrichomonas foetus]|eukprot:OHT01624.1 putative pseudouridine-5'-monophosphatase [Tritrichomonas foetus]
MSAWPHPIKAVIFDCDGTILNTLPIYFKANGSVLGFTYPPELAKKTNGRSELEVCRIIVDHFKLDMTPEKYHEKRKVVLNQLLPDSPLIPHVDELIRKIKDMKFPMAVATSCSREYHQLKSSKHRDLFNLFDYEVCGDEVKHAKPDPDVFQLASSKLGDFKPENVLVFEDAAIGVKAANAANMPVVVMHTNNDEFQENLKMFDAKPTVIVESFENFDFSLFKWEP